MTRRSRYGLIVAGLLIFAIGAPLLVLYVQGKTVSLHGTHTELTGLISAETSPSGAEILVNNDKKTSTPGAVRFLGSGDYIVTLTKPGYRTWQKRLAVVAGRVTHVNQNPTALVLLKDMPSTKLASDASLFAADEKTVFYTTSSGSQTKLVAFTKNSSSQTQSITLPGTASSLSIDTDTHTLLVQGGTFVATVDGKSLTLTDYSKNFNTVQNRLAAKGYVWGITSNNELVAGSGQNAPTTVVAQNVTAFAFRNNDLYYLTTDRNLHHATVDKLLLEQDQVLATNVPTGEKNTIYIDSAKAVYILADQRLLRINSVATEIATNVIKVSIASGTLSYTTPGELAWFNSSTNKSELVSRSSEAFSEFYIDPALQYALFIQGQDLLALELDDNSGQNRYLLDNTTTAHFSSLQFADNTTLLYLNGGDIRSVTIR